LSPAICLAQATTDGAPPANGTPATQPTGGFLDPPGTTYPNYQQGAVKKSGSIFKGIVKGLGKELGQNTEYMAKDAAFVFSAQDYDANKIAPPKGKPYEDYHIRWNDGTRSSIVRYPDGKQVIATGHRQGTVLMPLNSNTYDISYPNGGHGTLTKDGDGGFQIKRYDGAVISLSPKMGGGYYISTPDGQMGTIEPSVTDTQYGYYSPRDFMEF
jgi:hypothetical protein